MALAWQATKTSSVISTFFTGIKQKCMHESLAQDKRIVGQQGNMRGK